MTDDMMQNSAPPTSEEPQDNSEGYEVEICVYSDGSYAVSGPNPLQEPDEGEEVERVPDLATALKHVIAVIKQNPVSQDEEAQFKAGFEGVTGGEGAQPAGAQATVGSEPTGGVSKSY